MAYEPDMDLLLKPIPGANPAGENLRYTLIYDEIQEARRAEDDLDRGDWERPVKKSDWPEVVKLCCNVLETRTKDLQIGVWLLEALIRTRQMDGALAGLKILNGLLGSFWESLYPEIQDDDLDFRAAPLDYLNERVGLPIKEIPLTEPGPTAGYSWLQWQDSRQVGSEADILNRYGDVDEAKKKKREQLLAEGKLAAEEFDGAVACSSKAFYKRLATLVKECMGELNELVTITDDKFGAQSPSLEQFRKAFADLGQVVNRFLAEKLKADPDQLEEPEEARKESDMGENSPTGEAAGGIGQPPPVSIAAAPAIESLAVAGTVPDPDSAEQVVWQQAQSLLQASGIRDALGLLLKVSFSAPSVRARTRYRLLMAKLCLQAERPDLARPIAEELHAMLEELQLAKWESPTWIAEVLDALYQCLIRGEPGDEDLERARGLFQRLCTTDVTKAMPYRY